MSNTEKLFNLENRVAILTGGAGLLGQEYAIALAEAGAMVVLADINGKEVEKVANQISENSGARVLGIETDVSSKESVGNLVSETLSAFKQIDILINNAAINPKFDQENLTQHVNAFEEFPLDLWNQSLNINITGMFLCAQAVSKSMLDQGKGVIINVSSTYGLVGPDQRLYERSGNNVPTYKPVTYSVSKSAVLGLTRYLSTYWGNKNIRVNTLTPGGVFNGHDDEFVEKYSYRTPLGRMAHRSEYCGALLFLASDASSYMTGGNLVVDGGWTAW